MREAPNESAQANFILLLGLPCGGLGDARRRPSRRNRERSHQTSEGNLRRLRNDEFFHLEEKILSRLLFAFIGHALPLFARFGGGDTWSARLGACIHATHGSPPQSTACRGLGAHHWSVSQLAVVLHRG